MEKTDKLIRNYYAGTISQDEMDYLCRMFLDNEDVRHAYPDESRALVPLALARLSRRRQRKSVGRTWSVAASIAVPAAAAAAILLIVLLSRERADVVSSGNTTYASAGIYCNSQCNPDDVLALIDNNINHIKTIQSL